MVAYPFNINEVNKHPLDYRLRFEEEEHLYFLDNVPSNMISSVTTIIGRHFEPFSYVMASNACFKSKRRLTDETYDYYNMSLTEIFKKFERGDAAKAGTKMHAIIEQYYIGNDIEINSKELEYFIDFARDYSHLVPVRTEWMIFDDRALIAGSIDMLYFNEITEKFTIVDWKRAKSISKSSKKVCEAPLDRYTNCNYDKYSIQLNLYAYILLMNYGIDVDELLIVQLHPNKKNYAVYESIIDRPMARDLIQNRMNEIIKYQSPVTDFHGQLHAEYFKQDKNKCDEST